MTAAMYKITQIQVKASGNVHINHQNRGMWRDCCARWTGLSISVTAVLLGSLHTTVSSVYAEWHKNNKYPVSSSSMDGNDLLMIEVNGQWPDWFELTERLQ